MIFNTLASAFGIFLLIICFIAIAYICITFFIEDIEYIKAIETQRMIKSENDSWELFHPSKPNDTIECVQAIIDDASCYGFEFKVEDHNIYYREIN